MNIFLISLIFLIFVKEDPYRWLDRLSGPTGASRRFSRPARTPYPELHRSCVTVFIAVPSE
jgi:hypothetical protein